MASDLSRAWDRRRKTKWHENAEPQPVEKLSPQAELRKYVESVAQALGMDPEKLIVDDRNREGDPADPAIEFPGCGVLMDEIIVKRRRSLADSPYTTKEKGWVVWKMVHHPGVHTMPNGDPGYPDEDEDVPVSTHESMTEAVTALFQTYVAMVADSVYEGLAEPEPPEPEYEHSPEDLAETAEGYNYAQDDFNFDVARERRIFGR